MGRADSAQPWRELDSERMRLWADAMAERVVVDRANRVVSVSGPCPNCEHEFKVVLTDLDVLAGAGDQFRGGIQPSGDAKSVDWTGTIRILAFCYCEGDHAGRPTGTGHGCGAAGYLVDDP